MKNALLALVVTACAGGFVSSSYAQEVKKLPVLDDRSPDEIIGYNEHGLFD